MHNRFITTTSDFMHGTHACLRARSLGARGGDCASRAPAPTRDADSVNEEAQEARNKDVRSYRIHYARKDSRLRNRRSVWSPAGHERSQDQFCESRREVSAQESGSNVERVA